MNESYYSGELQNLSIAEGNYSFDFIEMYQHLEQYIIEMTSLKPRDFIENNHLCYIYKYNICIQRIFQIQSVI